MSTLDSGRPSLDPVSYQKDRGRAERTSAPLPSPALRPEGKVIVQVSWKGEAVCALRAAFPVDHGVGVLMSPVRWSPSPSDASTAILLNTRGETDPGG